MYTYKYMSVQFPHQLAGKPGICIYVYVYMFMHICKHMNTHVTRATTYKKNVENISENPHIV